MYVGREMVRTQLKVQHFKYFKLTFDKCGCKDILSYVTEAIMIVVDFEIQLL